jgi:DNA-directed RNA polymerase subunit omega
LGHYISAKKNFNKGFNMARTTNSDTLPYVDSRYELGMLASQRVRDLNGGAEPVVEQGRDKLTVVALREIASGKLDIANVRHEFVQSYKDTPISDSAEQSLEVESADPQLREIDAELENTLMDDSAVVAEEESDDTPDSDEE